MSPSIIGIKTDGLLICLYRLLVMPQFVEYITLAMVSPYMVGIKPDGLLIGLYCCLVMPQAVES